MTDLEFLAYMTSAAEDRVMVSGEQVNRLRELAGTDSNGTAIAATWWGTVDPANVEWEVRQAKRRRMAPWTA